MVYIISYDVIGLFQSVAEDAEPILTESYSMKKMINDPGDYVDHSLEGMVVAHPDSYCLSKTSARVVTRCVEKSPDKVGVVSGGGFGHLPLFAGFVGKGLLDTCAVGDVFAGPAADDVMVALGAAHKGGGILSVIGNYGGDRMTFEMQSELIAATGVRAEIVVVNDDVASAGKESAHSRRGVAGIVFAIKIAGAAAESGLPLNEVKRLTEKAVNCTRSVGVALAACFIPEAAKPTFQLEDDQIEMGMGIHGEKGVWRGPIKRADSLADEMVDRLIEDMPLKSSEQVAVLCNSLGATPIEELFIFYRRVAARLKDIGVVPVIPAIGHYATSMEMAGASLTLMKLDDELRPFFLADADCPFWSFTK